MSTEQKLLKKWRELSPERQQQVLEFVETLSLETAKNQLSDRPSQSDLGKRLRQIRAKIVASGEPLLNQDEIESEITSRRGGTEELA